MIYRTGEQISNYAVSAKIDWCNDWFSLKIHIRLYSHLDFMPEDLFIRIHIHLCLYSNVQCRLPSNTFMSSQSSQGFFTVNCLYFLFTSKYDTIKFDTRPIFYFFFNYRSFIVKRNFFAPSILLFKTSRFLCLVSCNVLTPL